MKNVCVVLALLALAAPGLAREPWYKITGWMCEDIDLVRMTEPTSGKSWDHPEVIPRRPGEQLKGCSRMTGISFAKPGKPETIEPGIVRFMMTWGSREGPWYAHAEDITRDSPVTKGEIAPAPATKTEGTWRFDPKVTSTLNVTITKSSGGYMITTNFSDGSKHSVSAERDGNRFTYENSHGDYFLLDGEVLQMCDPDGCWARSR